MCHRHTSISLWPSPSLIWPATNSIFRNLPLSLSLNAFEHKQWTDWSAQCKQLYLLRGQRQRKFTYFIRGSITVRMTFCVSSYFAHVNLTTNLLLYLQWYISLQCKWVLTASGLHNTSTYLQLVIVKIYLVHFFIIKAKFWCNIWNT